MPELPEVENVKLSLTSLGVVGQTFTQVELLGPGLRAPFPRQLKNGLRGQTLLNIERRAKYLLLETEKYYVVSHLGMTGSWRGLEGPDLRKHDHVILHFASGFRLAFNDPRRFGVLDLVRKEHVGENRWLKNLGVEPLHAAFSGEYLFHGTRTKKGAIKGYLMDQRQVVGVGNIYASEALFAARVKPTRAAGRLKRDEAERLVHGVRQILQAAIQAGGSTIRDYRNSHGESGRFQERFLVYGRAGSPCLTCGTLIRAKSVAGRNSFWCPQCQV